MNLFHNSILLFILSRQDNESIRLNDSLYILGNKVQRESKWKIMWYEVMIVVRGTLEKS